MKKNAFIFIVSLVILGSSLSLLFTQFGIAQTEKRTQFLQQDHCYTCHQEFEMLPQDFNEADIHLQEGLSCSGCHGGNPTSDDPDVAMNPKNGFVGVPDRQQIPQFCGKCHSSIEFMRKYRPEMETDQVTQYYTSVHGQRLQKGDQKVAECVNCHTAHKILSIEDTRSTVYPLNVPFTCRKCHSNEEYMKEYGIPTDQFQLYENSVHGKALLEKKDTGAPACNDCHGNHGATPPGVQSISHVCGNCHINNMDFFTSSPMAEVFQQMEFHACEKCHGNHGVAKTNDNMVGVGESSLCTECHSQGDSGYVAAREIHNDLETLDSKLDTAQTKLKQVQTKGMDDVDILFQLQEARQDLIHTRTLVHTFDPKRIHEKSQEGIDKTNSAIQLANSELKEYVTRKRGFGVATGFIILLTIALYFKIRDMEKRKKSE